MKPENILLRPLPEQFRTAADAAALGDTQQLHRDELLQTARELDLTDAERTRACTAKLKCTMACLCDFGCAAFRDQDQQQQQQPAAAAAAAVLSAGGLRVRGVSFKGSVAYSAPEVLFALHTRDDKVSAAGASTDVATQTLSCACVQMAPTSIHSDGGSSGSFWAAADPEQQAAARLLRSQGYDATAADVWSFGVTLYVLSAGRAPFSRAAVNSAGFRAYLRAEQQHCLGDFAAAPWLSAWKDDAMRPSSREWKWPQSFSPALVHLLRGCLAVRAVERPSMSQVLSHAWFRTPQWQPEAGDRALAPTVYIASVPRSPSCAALFAFALPGMLGCLPPARATRGGTHDGGTTREELPQSAGDGVGVRKSLQPCKKRATSAPEQSCSGSGDSRSSPQQSAFHLVDIPTSPPALYAQQGVFFAAESSTEEMAVGDDDEPSHAYSPTARSQQASPH